MTSASGIHYEDATSLVETIVSLKKKKYQFPGVDPEDTAQDIRMICWEALSRFDPAKMGKSVFHFIARCVDNRLYNKFRGVYLDNNPPCLRCPEYDKANKECLIDEIGCDRIVQYRTRMARRRAIAAPSSYSLDVEDSEAIPHSVVTGSLTGVSDLSDELRSSLSPDLRSYYDRIINGDVEGISLTVIRRIQTHVKSVMDRRSI